MNTPVVPLRRPHISREARVSYELARLRVADARAPSPRLAGLLRARD